MDEAANAEFSDYIADRIRRRVKDPEVAEKLIPRDHGFGVQRVPLETSYLEAYNRDNVHLVDHQRDADRARSPRRACEPSRATTSSTSSSTPPASTPSPAPMTRSTSAASAAKSCTTKWKDGPSTFLGMLTHGFPNLLMPTGPQSASASTNFPRGIETGVNWCTELMRYMWDRGSTRAEPTRAAEQRWTAPRRQDVRDHADAQSQGLVHRLQFQHRRPRGGQGAHFVYNGGTPKYVGDHQRRRRQGL